MPESSSKNKTLAAVYRRMLKIESSRISKNAILFYLKNAEATVSHDFGHTYQTALAATEHAALDGFSGNLLQDVFVTAIFHDIVRSSEHLTDKSGIVRSSKLVAEFCRNNGVSSDRARIITQSILKPLSTSIGKHIEFADAAQILLKNRWDTFKAENIAFQNATPKQISLSGSKKLHKKLDSLPKEARKELDAIATKVLKRKATGFQLGMHAVNTPPKNFKNRLVRVSDTLFTNECILLSMPFQLSRFSTPKQTLIFHANY